MNIAAYIRVSTDEQAEHGNSLYEQQERLKAYCKAMGWGDPVFYIDDGYSAKDLNRPALKKLLADISNSMYQRLVTTKLDRLSRKLLDVLTTIEYLDKSNCQFISSSESFDTSSSAGRLTLQLLGSFAEFERERTRERVKDNMLSIAKKGNKVIARPCFGYNVSNGALVINDDEAFYVKLMAEWCLSGEGSRAIAKKLNTLNVKTKDGNLWHDKIVRELLKRETLIGNTVYNKTYKKGTKIIQRDEKEWIRLENTHPAILDSDTYKKIQIIFNERKTIGRHLSEDRYLLSGLVYCGHCGSKMNGKMTKNYGNGPKSGNVHYRYACDGYLKKGVCFYHVVNRDELESLILEEIKKISEDNTKKVKIVENGFETKNNDGEKHKVQLRLDKLDKKMQKQISAFEDDLISARDLKLARERIEEERDELNKMIEKLNNKSDEVSDRRLRKNAGELSKRIDNLERIKIKMGIRELVHSIKIDNAEDVSIVWKRV